VVDAVAQASGSAVDVLGHSHGGICAFGATALTSNIGKLVLYEGWPVPNPEAFALPPGVEERMDALLGEGKREAAHELMLPDAQVIILEGQQHIAIDLIPEAFAGHVLGFLDDQPT
jgi:hypothetical protein